MAIVELIERNGCPLCGCAENSVHIPFPQIPVVQCKACGFLFSKRVMSPETLSSYYKENFGSLRHLQGQIVNARTNAWAITKFVDMHEIKEVLDVGTGYGFFLQALSGKFNVNVTGVELSEQEAAYAKEELNLDVRNAALTKAGLEKESYDLLTSFEVIEHVSDPVQLVHEMGQYLKPVGYLLILTDNFESRIAKLLGAGFPKWIPHSHISHFSPETLKKTINGEPDLDVYGELSYSPWEFYLRSIYYKLRGIKKTPSEAFQLSEVLETEMGGTYKWFWLRKRVNSVWAKMTLSKDMNGALMYLAARKQHP